MEMPTRQWNDYMTKRLQEHPEEIPGYLNACAEEGRETFLVGLRRVVLATSSVSAMARDTGLTRNAVQKMLAPEGNPRLDNLEAVLQEVGFRLTVAPMGEPANKTVAKRKPKQRRKAVASAGSAPRQAAG